MILSRILPAVSSMHSGRYEDGSSGGLPGFGSRTSLWRFQLDGKTPVSRHVVYTRKKMSGRAATAILSAELDKKCKDSPSARRQQQQQRQQRAKHWCACVIFDIRADSIRADRPRQNTSRIAGTSTWILWHWCTSHDCGLASPRRVLWNLGPQFSYSRVKNFGERVDDIADISAHFEYMNFDENGNFADYMDQNSDEGNDTQQTRKKDESSQRDGNVQQQCDSASQVWQHATLTADKSMWLCLQCKKKFKYSKNTSNLIQHLSKKHPLYFTYDKKEKTIKETHVKGILLAMERVQRRVISELVRVDNYKLNINNNDDTSPPSKKSKPCPRVLDDTKRKSENLVTQRDIDNNKLHPELVQFYKLARLDRDEDPIKFWEKKREAFPNLAPVALKYVAGLATSVPSERLFSQAGLQKSKIRNRLSPETLNMIVFLHSCQLEDWLLKVKIGKSTNINQYWRDNHVTAFQQLKSALINARMLGYYDPEDKTQVIADASPVGLGAVLIQIDRNGPRVIVYGSKSLTDCENRFFHIIVHGPSEGYSHLLYFNKDRKYSESEKLQ
ncbi:unnamed protein product [Trichogramma brassicae]|uniref:BED-type domain-containing protein n=1 Tax=Trichogramma brassicae TaxID=86971 RepID=A0A6H5IUQ2_9HYME|nr:unnamed protein product [Trichogramma brassicae]